MWATRNRRTAAARAGSGGLPSLGGKFSLVMPGDLRTSWLKANVAEATSSEWDGYVVEARLSDSDVGDGIHTQALKHTPDTVVNAANLAAMKTDLETTDWSTGTKPEWIFLRVDARPSSNTDWNNSTHTQAFTDAFSAIGTVSAQLQTSLGIRIGLIIDPETYDDDVHGGTADKALFSYNDLTNPSARTYAQTRDDVRAAFDAMLDAYWDAHSTGHVVLTLGTHYVVVKADELGETYEDYKYGLLRDAVDGILDARSTHPSAYVSDYVQLGYNSVSVSSHDYYKTNPTFGYDGNAAVDAAFRATNVSDLMYDRAVWTNSDGRYGTSGTVIGGNTIVFEDDIQTQSLLEVGDEVYIEGVGVRQITARPSTTSITVSGLEFNLGANSYVSTQKPIDTYNALVNGEAAATRFCLVYMSFRFRDAINVTAASRTRFPAEIRTAWTRANQGLDTGSLTTIATASVITTPALSDQIDTSNLVAHYLSPDSDGSWDDISGNSLDLTEAGTVTRGGSAYDYYAEFDATGDRLSRASVTADHAGSGDIWYATRALFNNLTGTNNGLMGIQNELILRLNESNDSIWTIGYSAGATVSSVANSITQSTWHAIQSYKSGSDLVQNVDGSESTGTLNSSTLDTTTNDFELGDLYGTFPPNGDIAEAIIVGNAPSTTEKSRIQARLSLRPVEYWKALFDTQLAAIKATEEAYADGGNSAAMLDQSYYLDGLVSMYESTGDISYLTDAMTLVTKWIASAALSSTLTTNKPTNNSQYQDSYLGWQGSTLARNPGRTGFEYNLDESYLWKYVARLLYVIYANGLHENSSLSTDYATVLEFCEDNMMAKWYTRGNDSNGNGTLFQGPGEGVHRTMQWYQFSLYLRQVTQDSTTQTRCDYVIDNVNDNTDGTPANLSSTNVKARFGNHPTFGALGYDWSRDFAASISQDWFHANDVISAIVAARKLGSAKWLDSDITRLVYTFNQYGPGGTYPLNVDGSGGNVDGFIASGWVKLGQFDIEAARNCEQYSSGANSGGVLGIYGNLALNTRKLGFA